MLPSTINAHERSAAVVLIIAFSPGKLWSSSEADEEAALESDLAPSLGSTTHLLCDPKWVLFPLGACFPICKVGYLSFIGVLVNVVCDKPAPRPGAFFTWSRRSDSHMVFIISGSCCAGQLVPQRAQGQSDKGLGLCCQTELSLNPPPSWALGLLQSCCTSSMENSAWHAAGVQ